MSHVWLHLGKRIPIYQPARFITFRPNRIPHSSLSRNEAAKTLRLARSKLVNSVDGFIPRNILRIRLFLMGTRRPFGLDDAMALMSWGIVSNTMLVMLATTTFFSLLILTLNTLHFKEAVATTLGEYLTNTMGVRITMDSAVQWKNGMIRLVNVHILCNPATWNEWLEKHPHPSQVDYNWSYWDVKIDSVDITLSFWRWLDGRGLVEHCEIKGVRGIVDRQHLEWENWIPKRRAAELGDFDIDSLIIQDLMLTIKNRNFRDFCFSIFKAEIPRFRKNWMLYDFLGAESITGLLDECLYSIHVPQMNVLPQTNYSMIRNLKITGLPIDHFTLSVTGPMSWITKGNVDMDIMMLFPEQIHGENALERFIEEIENLKMDTVGQLEIMMRPFLNNTKMDEAKRYGTLYQSTMEPQHNNMNDMILYSKININDLKAVVPYSIPQLSYMNNALIRPLVAYMNANKTKISLECSAKIDINNFNGSWDIYTSGLFNVLSEEMGNSLVKLIKDEKQTISRLKEFGKWSIVELSKRILIILDHILGKSTIIE